MVGGRGERLVPVERGQLGERSGRAFHGGHHERRAGAAKNADVARAVELVGST